MKKENRIYLLAFCIILLLEILIGLFVRDAFVRPYVGDVLAVILMYTLVRGIVQKPVKLLPLWLFLFAGAVELAQYFRIVQVLHLQGNRLISTVIGTSADIRDVLCYLVAAVLLMVWERIISTQRNTDSRQ